MAFQIVELTFDANASVIERKVVPYPYQTREEAVTAIECIVSTFVEAGYEPEQKFWWAIATSGDRIDSPSRRYNANPDLSGIRSETERMPNGIDQRRADEPEISTPAERLFALSDIVRR